MLPPAVKALIFSALLAGVVSYGGFFWYLIFLLGALYFYFRSFVEIRTFLYSYIIIVIYALLVTRFLGSGIYITLSSLAFGFLFFLLLGVKNLIFISRQSVFNFLTGILYFIVIITYFIAYKIDPFRYIFYLFLSFGSFYLLIKESLDFLFEDFLKKKKVLIALTSAFMIVEAMSVVSLLPIGFLNSAVLVLMMIFVLEDFIFYHIKGGLSRQAVYQNIAIMVISAIFIFITSRWGI